MIASDDYVLLWLVSLSIYLGPHHISMQIQWNCLL